MFSPKTRKRLVLVAIALGLLFVALVIGQVAQKRHQKTEGSALTASNSSLGKVEDVSPSRVVTLSNTTQFNDLIDSNDVVTIESDLYDRIISGDTVNSYRGMVRQSSFSITTAPYQTAGGVIQLPTYSFLVDIPSVKQSYRVNVQGGTNFPVDEVSIRCPAPVERVYPEFACEDVQ